MSDEHEISRRGLLKGVAATAGAKAAGGGTLQEAIAHQGTTGTLPRRGTSGIKHVVVVMMENRSFDHFLGWTPHADGRQAGLTYTGRDGATHATYPLAPDYQGCGHPDPDHSFQAGRVEWDNGACDGWLRAGANDEYAIGYYTQADLAFLGQAVPQWTTFDRYFASIMAETLPNRFYQHAAQTDRLTDTYELSTLPTIWDRLHARGISGRYYYSDVPFLALWGIKYLPISRPFGVFLTDCALGTLPHVSFVDPRFLGESSGTSGDDHPHADIRNGEAFMWTIYQAVTSSPVWRSTILIFNYDEWGGFFEHVAPPRGPVPPAVPRSGDNDDLLGFRVPCLLVAPWARRGYVSNTVYDHTSILKMIEWRWNLQPLTERDANANNLAEALDFSRFNPTAPHFSVPIGPFGGPCAAAAAAATEEEWAPVQAIAAQHGWPV